MVTIRTINVGNVRVVVTQTGTHQQIRMAEAKGYQSEDRKTLHATFHGISPWKRVDKSTADPVPTANEKDVMCDFYSGTNPSKSSGSRLRRMLVHTQMEWVSILVVHRLSKCHGSRTLMVWTWKRWTNWA